MTVRRDQRSAGAAVYRRLYKTTAWLTRRLAKLAANPLCEWCEGQGKVAAATEVHHAIPHKGDEVLFHTGPLVSLCKPCHDGEAQGIERRGYSDRVGLDGWPVDPRHPGNTRGTA